MRHTFALVLISALAFAPACKKKQSETSSTTTTETTGSGSSTTTTTTTTTTGSGSAEMAAAGSAGSAAPAAGGLTDPQIAAIVVAANQVDIDAGNLALKKTKNEEVKKFAQQMVTDHTAVNKAAGDLVAKLKVTPEETDASKGLVKGGADNRANLEKLDGAAFDKAYVDNEVAYHKAVIDTIDSKLIPSASNADLKSTLVSVKPTIQAHLEHAEMLQGKLNGGAGSAAPAGHKM
jgi:putative membrane protein